MLTYTAEDHAQQGTASTGDTSSELARDNIDIFQGQGLVWLTAPLDEHEVRIPPYDLEYLVTCGYDFSIHGELTRVWSHRNGLARWMSEGVVQLLHAEGKAVPFHPLTGGEMVPIAFAPDCSH